MKAHQILEQASAAMQQRAASRDKPQGERSMRKTIEGFNALTGHKLSERDGWLFMVVLKIARATTTPLGQLDDYTDGAAYMALAGELVLEHEVQEPHVLGQWGKDGIKKSDRSELDETMDSLDKEYKTTYGSRK